MENWERNVIPKRLFFFFLTIYNSVHLTNSRDTEHSSGFFDSLLTWVLDKVTLRVKSAKCVPSV